MKKTKFSETQIVEGINEHEARRKTAKENIYGCKYGEGLSSPV